MGEYGAAASWEEEGGCGLRHRGRRRRGLRRRVRKKAVRQEEEGAAACKRRWGKGLRVWVS
jgi:hypothetical protein